MPKSTLRRSIAAAVLFLALAAVPVTASAAGKAAAGSNRTHVIAAQEELNRQGASLKVDGVLGRATRNSLRAYQRSHGLKASGRLDRSTGKSLKIA